MAQSRHAARGQTGEPKRPDHVREYTYLTRKDAEDGQARPDHDVVEACYNRQALERRPVVRDELRRKYMVFESRDALLRYYDALPEGERCGNEVVFGHTHQRLKFDIDAPEHKVHALPDAVVAAARPRPAEVDDGYVAALLGERPDSPAEDPFAPSPHAADPPVVAPVAAPVVAPADKVRAAVDALLDAILDELHDAYRGVTDDDFRPARGDFAVTDSSGPEAAGYKHSYHIISLSYAVENHAEAAEFTARVLDRLPAVFRPLVDAGVNKRTQNFRLAGSVKPGSRRVKRATAEAAERFDTRAGVGPADLFVTAEPWERVLPVVYADGTAGGRGAGRPRLPDAVARAVLDLAEAAGVTAGHAYRESRGTLLCFTRQAPSHCRLCGETHHNDNSLMLAVERAEPEAGVVGAGAFARRAAAGPAGTAACRVTELCRQAPGRAREVGLLDLAEDDLAALEGAARRAGPRGPDAPAGLAALLAARVAAVSDGRVNPHAAQASEFERLPAERQAVYSEAAMRPYERAPTLAVKAQMGLGKTAALRAYLDQHYPADGLETAVIRFVTFRQTFSRSLTQAFGDFALYSEEQGDLDPVRHPRLIVQAESLHRLRPPAAAEAADLLVLDEAESTLAQFGSGLHRYFGASFATFAWLVSTARHVICMDANLGDRTFRTLARMRPNHPPLFHWNRYARAAGDTYRVTADLGGWLESLHGELRAGRRVVLPTNSLSEARAFDEALRAEFPAKKIALYSSETAPSERARHFGDVHTYWSELDVLIYTPTCSAGVSYERAHFDSVYAYFCDQSCDVETCRQMLGRVRALSARTYTVCLRATGAAHPTETAEIHRLIHDKRAGLYRQVRDAALLYGYTADGAVRYYETDYYYLWLENERVRNLSRNDFARRFIDQVADTGARVEALTVEAAAAAAVLAEQHRGTRADLKARRCAEVAAAAELTPDEAAEVREARQAQLDVEPALRLAHEKYVLREAYGWHGRPLDAAFVAAYQPAAARRVYQNLRRLTAAETVDEALAAVQRAEAGRFSFVTDPRGPGVGRGPAPGRALGNHAAESRDLNNEKALYTFQGHATAIWLARLCGFRDVFDGRRVGEAALEARLRAALPLLERAAPSLAYEFEAARPDFRSLAREADRARFLARALRLVNSALRWMYGVQVARLPKREGQGLYRLRASAVGRLFVFRAEAEPDDRPGGPRPHIVSRLRAPPAEDPDAAPAPGDEAGLFLEEVFYDHRPAADEPLPAAPLAEPPLAPPPGEDALDAAPDSFDEFLDALA